MRLRLVAALTPSPGPWEAHRKRMEALDSLGTSHFNFQAIKPGRIKPKPRVNLFNASTTRAVPAQISTSIEVRRPRSMACNAKPRAAPTNRRRIVHSRDQRSNLWFGRPIMHTSARSSEAAWLQIQPPRNAKELKSWRDPKLCNTGH